MSTLTWILIIIGALIIGNYIEKIINNYTDKIEDLEGRVSDLEDRIGINDDDNDEDYPI